MIRLPIEAKLQQTKSLKDKSILLVCTNADLAGAPLHVQSLAEGIFSSFDRVAAVFGEDGPVRARLELIGIQTYIVPTMRSRISPIGDLKALKAIRSIVQEVRPNLIHAHSSKAGMLTRIVGSQLNIPVIYTVHGWGFGEGRRKIVSWLVKFAELYLKNRTSHYIAVSEADLTIGVQSLGVKPNKISAVHNGIGDNSRYAQPSTSHVVVMVARDDYQKDYATLFKAVENLKCETWCIGRGTDSIRFKEAARAIAPSAYPNIVFFGARSDVPELLSRGGIFVLSSRFEGLPLSILEAMRAGLPVIASDVGGVCELVSAANTGYLVPPGNSNALTEKLKILLSDSALRSRLGSSGRKLFIEKFSFLGMVEKTIDVYSDVLLHSPGLSAPTHNISKGTVVICNSTTWYTYNFRLPLIQALTEDGYKVIVAAPPDAYTKKLDDAGVVSVPIKVNSWSRNVFNEIFIILQYYNLFRKTRPKVVLNFTPKPNIYGAMAARIAGVPCVSNIAGLGTAYARSGILKIIVRMLYRISQRSATRVFFQNIDDMRLFLTDGIVSQKQAELLPGSGVELDRFQPLPSKKQDKVTFLLIARLIWEKGVGEYIKAARIVRANYPNTTFLLVGYIDTENPSAIPIDVINAWVAEGIIDWHGRQEDVRKFIADSDCVVLPSYYREGIPRTLLEAASMGKPIIGANTIGCKEPVRDGVNGFLCQAKNPGDLADCMMKVIQLGFDERALMGRNGRRIMEAEYDSRIVVNKYLSLIRQIQNAWIA